ncbi:MAG: TRAP transporter large permease [Synergistaceae bacterium]|nr:TRAP transporter large permease [Synergistaceae bacterium]
METGVLVSLVLFLGLIVIGMPLGWVFIASTAVGLFLIETPLSFMAGTFFHSLNTPVVMAIGFFVFAGGLISEAGLADRIVRFSYALVGKAKGGLIVVGIVATLFMSALTGSSVPCISALIPLLVPRLEKFGYQKRYTTAVLCSSSFMGYLIPPSVPALIYCLVAQQSVAALFLATVIPGLLLALGYCILNYFIVDRYTFPSAEKPVLPDNFRDSMKELGAATWSALPALGCPLIILVGIYGGICTPNEAGAIAVIYCMIVGFFVYRDLKLGNFSKAIVNTCVTLGMIALLLGGGTVLTRFMTREGVAQALAETMLGLFHSKFLILISINLFLLLLGMFLDGIPILILAVPLILPLANELGINLVHLGSMIIVNIGLGVMTPPFAMSIFVGSRLSGVPAGELIPPMMIYLFCVGIPVLLLTTYIPFLSCWLPTLALGAQVVGPW